MFIHSLARSSEAAIAPARPPTGPSDDIGATTSKKRTRPTDSVLGDEAAGGERAKKRKPPHATTVMKREQRSRKGNWAELKSKADSGGFRGRQAEAAQASGAADHTEAGPSTAPNREEEAVRADVSGRTAPVTAQTTAYELAESKARVGDEIQPPVECDRCLHLGKPCVYVIGAHKKKPTQKVVMARCTGCQTAKSACSLVPRFMHDGRVFKNSIAGTAAAEWRIWVAGRKAERLPYPDLPIWNGIQGKPGSWVVDLDTWDNTDKRVGDRLKDWVALRQLALSHGQLVEPPKLDKKGNMESEPESDEEGHKATQNPKKRRARKKAKLVGPGILPDKPFDLDEEADVSNCIETPGDETGDDCTEPALEVPQHPSSRAAGKRPVSPPKAAQAHPSQEDDVISNPDSEVQTDAFAGLIRTSPVPSSPIPAHAGPSLSAPQTLATPSVPAPLSSKAAQEAEAHIGFPAKQVGDTMGASDGFSHTWSTVFLQLSKQESEKDAAFAALQARVEEMANRPAPSIGPTWSEVEKIREELALTTGRLQDMEQQVSQLREKNARLEGFIADISADVATTSSGVEQACNLKTDIHLFKEGIFQAMDGTLDRVRDIETNLRADIDRLRRAPPSPPQSPPTPVRLPTSSPPRSATLPYPMPRPADEKTTHDTPSPLAPGSPLPPVPAIDELVEDTAPTTGPRTGRKFGVLVSRRRDSGPGLVRSTA